LLKKTTKYFQRNHSERLLFLRKLRELIVKFGSENIVYMDESGFTAESYRPHGWAARGTKIYGDVSGNNRKTTNLIMAQRKNQWVAPMLFSGTCSTETVNTWMEKLLIPELEKPSVVVMDNARFHNKQQLSEILEKNGHVLLPLPRYSPDFNKIEKSFAVIKKRRQFAINDNKKLENILMGNL